MALTLSDYKVFDRKNRHENTTGSHARGACLAGFTGRLFGDFLSFSYMADALRRINGSS
jgi:hypothetical protein